MNIVTNKLQIKNYEELKNKRIGLIIRITNRCNMNCSFCFRKEEEDYKENILSNEWDNISFEKFKEKFDMFSNEICGITFSGGEPLLNFDMVKKIIEYIKNRQNNISKFMLNTNGILLNDNIVNYLKHNNISINLGLATYKEKNLETLRSKNKNILSIINNNSNIKITCIVEKNKEWYNYILYLHSLLPNTHICCQCDNNDLPKYTKYDIYHYLNELTKVILTDENYDKWLSPTYNTYDIFEHKLYKNMNENKLIPVIMYSDGEFYHKLDELKETNFQNTYRYLPEELDNILCKSIENIYDKKKFNTQIHTNSNCNLRCKYCFEHNKEIDLKINDVETIKKYIKLKFDEWYIHSTNCNVYIDFIGGEPTLCFDNILKPVFEYIHNLYYNEYECTGKLLFGISTNGILIGENKELQDFILKWKDYFSIGFSLDGDKETNDLNRVDINGNGSYDRIIKSLNWMRENNLYCSVKATFNHDTYNNYAKAVKHLIDLGFTKIAANVDSDQIWNDDDCEIFTNQMYDIIDYVFEKGLQNKVELHKINRKNEEINKIEPIYLTEEKYIPTHNYCGCADPMNCLGYDGKIYGCHRLAEIKENDYSIKEIKNNEIITTNEELINELKLQYTTYPKECLECNLLQMCSNCTAATFISNKNNNNNLAVKSQCGFVKACYNAQKYFIKKYEEYQKEITPKTDIPNELLQFLITNTKEKILFDIQNTIANLTYNFNYIMCFKKVWIRITPELKEKLNMIISSSDDNDKYELIPNVIIDKNDAIKISKNMLENSNKINELKRTFENKIEEIFNDSIDYYKLLSEIYYIYKLIYETKDICFIVK